MLIVLCHLIGDYVLQCDFIAQTKGKNWYHLFIHCALYCVPFLIIFGWTWQLEVIFISHLIIDPLKARWNKITYTQDQVLHYIIGLIYLLWLRDRENDSVDCRCNVQNQMYEMRNRTSKKLWMWDVYRSSTVALEQ